MSILSRFTERWFPSTSAYMKSNAHLRDENWHLEESLTRLQLEIENQGYLRLGQSEHDFSRVNLDAIIKLSVTMALKNPITIRSVNVQSDYVFGRGVKFVAAHPLVQSVIDEHTEYCENSKALYSHSAMAQQERELQVKGNLFYALFTNVRTGRVIVRDIDTLEVADIIRDPGDYQKEWFIKRTWSDGNGKAHVTYYPALGIDQASGVSLPANAEAGDIEWDTPVYHACFNRFGHMKFGIPEIWAQIDWALAYKRFLEDWSSIMRAFARMAMKISGLGGKKQAGAAKSMMQTSVSLGNPLETNPSAAAASTGVFSKGVDIEPVKTAGATTPAKDGQPLLNMAAAAIGLPNTFFGDASIGHGATATTLDRPTELRMVARQRLWSVIFGVILDYVIFMAVKANAGLLQEAGASLAAKVDPFTNQTGYEMVMPKNDNVYYGVVGDPISTKVLVKFPELLERNVTDRVRALCNALSMFGKPLTDIIPDKRLVSRLLMEALNIEGIDELIPQFVAMWERNMTAGDDGKPVDPIIIPPPPPMQSGGAEDAAQGGDVGANG